MGNDRGLGTKTSAVMKHIAKATKRQTKRTRLTVIKLHTRRVHPAAGTFLADSVRPVRANWRRGEHSEQGAAGRLARVGSPRADRKVKTRSTQIESV